MSDDDARLHRMAAELQRTAVAGEASTRAERGAQVLRVALRALREDVAEGSATDKRLEQSLSIGQALQLGPNAEAAAEMVEVCEEALGRSQRSFARRISRILRNCFHLEPVPRRIEVAINKIGPGISDESSARVTQVVSGYIEEIRLHKKARELGCFARFRCYLAAKRGQ